MCMNGFHKRYLGALVLMFVMPLFCIKTILAQVNQQESGFGKIFNRTGVTVTLNGENLADGAFMEFPARRSVTIYALPEWGNFLTGAIEPGEWVLLRKEFIVTPAYRIAFLKITRDGLYLPSDGIGIDQADYELSLCAGGLKSFYCARLRNNTSGQLQVVYGQSLRDSALIPINKSLYFPAGQMLVRDCRGNGAAVDVKAYTRYEVEDGNEDISSPRILDTE